MNVNLDLNQVNY